MLASRSSQTQGPEGLVGGYTGDSTAIQATIAVLIAILLYNASELAILIPMTFRHYRGLYFWSILLSSTMGLIPSGIGNLLHFFSIGPLWLALTLSIIGFYFMIPGQSLVLYSRLHLVLYNQRILRLVLCAVITSTALVAFPTTVTTFGSAFVRTHPWNEAYTAVERLQVTWFCVQESVISYLYIRVTIRLLRLSPANNGHRRKIMYELLAINVFIVLMDTAIVVLEFFGLYFLQVLLKCMIYSIKLKLEFAVLGKLTAVVNTSCHGFSEDSDYGLSFITEHRECTVYRPTPCPVTDIAMTRPPSRDGTILKSF